MYDLILRDATIVSSEGRAVADVAVADGRIAYVGPRPPRAGREEINAIGKFLLPGVIDTAVQLAPYGSADQWEQESKAAVSGGTTTVVVLPGGADPVRDRASARRRLATAARRSWCHYLLWGEATAGNAEELAGAVEEGLLVGGLATIGGEQGGLGPEDLAAFLALPGVLGLQLHSGDAAVDPILARARSRTRPLHLVHLSTAAELLRLDPSRSDLALTAGVTPHHLFLSLEEGGADLPVGTRPPIRAEQDRRALWTALKRGRLHCIASDHHPSNPENGVREGLPGAELLLPLMLGAVRYGRLGLEMLAALCCEGPAQVLGLERKGRIERGYDADLVLFSEGEIGRVDPATLLSGAGWSPYVSREVSPKPELVLLGGRPVARRGDLVGDGPIGEHARQR